MSEGLFERMCFGCAEPIDNDVKFCPHCRYDLTQGMSKHPNALQQGTVLNGKYMTGPVLAEDAAGITYSGKECTADSELVIKEYFPASVSSRTASKRITAFKGPGAESYEYGKSAFLNEAKTLTMFTGSSNIACVYNYFEENGTVYSVTELTYGKSLKQFMNERGRKLPWNEVQKFLFPVTEALSDIHSFGVIHGAISADNIIITDEGAAKLVNFSSAQNALAEKNDKISAPAADGFTPPELYSKDTKPGAYSDVYALAAVYYYMLTGSIPMDAKERMKSDDMKRPVSMGAAIAPEKEHALVKALAMRPSDRFQTVSEFLKALSGSAPAANTQTEQKKPAAAAGEEKKKSGSVDPKFIKIGIAAAAVLIIGIGVSAAMNSGGNEIKTQNSTTEAKVIMANNVALPETDETKATEEESTGEENTGEDSADAQIAGESQAAMTSPSTYPTGKTRKKTQEESEQPEDSSPEESETTADTTRPVEAETTRDTQAAAVTTAADQAPAATAGTSASSVSTTARTSSSTAATTARTKTTTAQTKKTTAATTKAVTTQDNTQYTNEKYFTYKEENGGITITGYKGKDKKVLIPKTIKGKQVKKLQGTVDRYPDGELDAYGSSGIFDVNAVTQVVLPNGLNEITDFALAGLKVSSIEIPNGVTVIGTGAFFGSEIKSVKIPLGVTVISESSFASCNNLSSVEIPGSVVSIGASAFENCEKLTGISLPSRLTRIGDNAFKFCSRLKSITIPDSVTSLGSGTFYQCESLKSVTLSKGLKTLNSYLFSYCSSLTEVDVPAGVSTIAAYVFEYCTGLQTVKIPSGAKVDSNTFSGCSDVSIKKK